MNYEEKKRVKNGEALYDAITDIREDFVIRAQAQPLKQSKHPKRKWWIAATAAALALAILGGVLLFPSKSPMVLSVNAIAEAEYPKMAAYPNPSDYQDANGNMDDEAFDKAFTAWSESLNAQRQALGDTTGFERFFAVGARQFLSGDSTENHVYSPINVYMALSMLAELTEGSSRRQILKLLCCDSIADVRTQASALWNANYRNDGAVACVLANSIWLDNGLAFCQETMDTLAKDYYASSYFGKMGGDEMNQALREWLKQQTGGLLEGQAIELPEDALLALASTVYFRAKWTDEFDESQTGQGVFHASTGDTNADFMHRSSADIYYRSEHFGATARSLESGGRMWFILPDEGATAEQILSETDFNQLLLHSDDWAEQKDVIIHYAIPKFDVSSQMELSDHLQAMGITDIFDPGRADFTPAGENGLYISKVQHDTRVAIDEEGVTAAAYTVIMGCGAGAPPTEEIDFTLNRPFLFVITSADGLPLFTGIINQPS